MALLLSLVVSLAAVALAQERARHRERAAVATQNIAQLLDQHVGSVFDKIDLSLQSAAYYYREQATQGRLDPAKINAFLSQEQRLLPEVVHLRIFGSDGAVRFGSAPMPGEQTDVSDRAYFARARDDARSSLVISEPLLARMSTSTQWVIVLARRIDLPDGTFGGVVCAAVATASFEKTLASADLGPHGAATLRTADLALVHRYPDSRRVVGSKQVSRQLHEAIVARPAAGSYVAPTALDGIERANAYRRLERFPFYVIVGLATSEFLGGWASTVRTISGLTALAALVMTLAAVLVHRATQRLAADIVARRQTETLLLASEQELKKAQRLAGMGNWSWNLKTGQRQWSEQIHQILGLDPALPPGSDADVQQYFSAECWERLAGKIDRCRTEGTPYAGDAEVVRADGTRRWVSLTGEAARGPDGSVALLRGTMQDITERRQLDSRLAASINDLRDLYDHAPCGYHSLDGDGKFLQINATALSWLGCEAEELIGKKGPMDFFTVEGKARFLDGFPLLKRVGHVEGLECDLLGRNGTTRRVRIDANAVYDPAGNFVMSRSVLFDITALRRLETQTRQLLREQTALLDNDLVAILKLKDRRVVWHNRGIQRIFGYTAEEFRGQSSRLLYPDDTSFETIGAAGYAVVRAGGIYRTQTEMVRKDGQRLWVDVSGEPVSDESDVSIWLLADITALKEAQEIRLKTVELEAENHQLRETGRLNSLFLANMSHELRTPLNAVIGLASLLQAGVVRPDSPKFDTFIGQIGASGRDLLQMIDGVLDFAKAAAGTIDFHPVPVDLPALAREVIDILQAAAAAKHIEVAVDFDPALVDLVIDPLRLKQALSNYLSNAIKFTPAHGQVTLRTRAEGPERFRIEVQDSGIGIAAADLPRLFTEFQQLSSGSTKSHGGTGLGLALTRRLVEAQGGTVGVRSTPGVGSVFHLVLPRRQGAAAVPLPPAAAPEP